MKVKIGFFVEMRGADVLLTRAATTPTATGNMPMFLGGSFLGIISSVSPDSLSPKIA